MSILMSAAKRFKLYSLNVDILQSSFYSSVREIFKNTIVGKRYPNVVLTDNQLDYKNSFKIPLQVLRLKLILDLFSEEGLECRTRSLWFNESRIVDVSVLKLKTIDNVLICEEYFALVDTHDTYAYKMRKKEENSGNMVS